MKKILLLLLLGVNLYGFAQNNAWILAPRYHKMLPGGTGPAQLLPTAVGGYQGAAATGAQNIITDASGQIIFFIVDKNIYGRNGELIDVFEIGSIGGAIDGVNSEIVVVKDPQDCNIFHLLSTRDISPSVKISEAYYAKLRVSYNSQGQLNANSGFYYTDIDDCSTNMKKIETMIGSAYYSFNGGGGNPHDENALFAVAPANSSGVQKVYVMNDKRIFRFTLSSSAFTYDNYYIDLYTNVYTPLQVGGQNNDRREFEVVKLANGNYRLGFLVEYIIPGVSGLKTSVGTIDLNSSGTYITGTQKLCEYENSGFVIAPNSYIAPITGLEFSPNGEKIFVTHAKYSLGGNSTLDSWDLTSTPVKTILSTNLEFQTSHIEAAVDGSLMLPRQNYLAKISTPNGTPTLNETAVSITSYNHTINNTRNYVRLLQDQVDGEDYGNLSPVVYNAFVYNVTTSGTWKPNTIANSYNNNPLIYGLGSVVNIEKELRIKAGTTLTIENMIFKFSPGARVVIENGANGQGGKLIMNGTTFTNNDNCNNNELWLGVEVWGNQNQTQGNVSNSTQGRLIMSNSTIENASIGVLVSKRTTSFGGIPVYNTFCEPQSGGYLEIVNAFTFDNSRNGGVVQATNSTFLNNQRGVWFRPHSTTSNNLSYFNLSHFIWNDDILTSTQDLAKLETVFGINFKGCNFKNEITTGSYALGGHGIFARESQFYVIPHCSLLVLGQPCANPIPNVFQNLNFGIRAWNLTNNWTFTCSENEFVNNRYGVYVSNTKTEKILKNTFAIREASSQSSGISLYNSTGYQVQENELFEHDNPLVTNGTGQSIGIVVNNSGNYSNEIYKNYFHNLKIGGQTEGINGMYVPNPTADSISGLQWLCNDFQHDIYLYDLTLMSGRMNYHQGSASGGTTHLDAKKRVANNKFSLTGEPSVDQHDIFVSDNSQHFSYAFIKAPRHEPDSYTFSNNLYGNVVNIDEALWGGSSIIEDAGSCPSKISGGPILGFPIAGLKTQQKELLSKIDNAMTEELLTLMDTGSDNEVKSTLMEASPYLSDEVLIKYINSNPPSSNLKEVMIANSNLSDGVKEVLSNHSMPNGTANQIAEAQIGVSKREELFSEINYLEHQIETGYAELIGGTLLDDSDTASVENLISLLEEIGDYDREKLLLSTYVSLGNDVKAEEQREVVTSMKSAPHFIALTHIQESITQNRTVADALEESPEIVIQIQDLISVSEDKNITLTAQFMLDALIDSDEVPLFLTASKSKSGNIPAEQETEIDLHRNFNVNIYPNPSTGIVNFDYPDNNVGTLEIQIVSLDGKVKAEFVAKDTNGEQFNVNHLDKGYYLVKIKLDGQVLETQKLEIF